MSPLKGWTLTAAAAAFSFGSGWLMTGKSATELVAAGGCAVIAIVLLREARR